MTLLDSSATQMRLTTAQGSQKYAANGRWAHFYKVEGHIADETAAVTTQAWYGQIECALRSTGGARRELGLVSISRRRLLLTEQL